MKTIEILSKLENAFQTELPGLKAHREMAPLDRILDINLIPDIDQYRKSAVSIILYQHQDELRFILIQRPIYEGTHGGQISFPGGKQEEIDSDLENTARRETFEEIGVQLNENQLIGSLSAVVIPVSKFCVEPYLYFIEEQPVFTPDEREVAYIIETPLLHLLNDENKKSKSIELSNGVKMKNVPYFELASKTVWGATALILNELKWLLKEDEKFKG